jgi:trimeric autotransporter adhesin
MNKTLLILFTILLSLQAFSQDINIPDDNFRKALIKEGIDQNGDGKIQEFEVFLVEKLNISGRNISNMEGIQYFLNLTDLDCSNNNITRLDISRCQTIQSLKCNNNKLTKLDLTQQLDLTNLNCSGNQLKSVNISKNRALLKLNCMGNQLDTLGFINNKNLTSIICSTNNLTSLDISKNTKLKELFCDHNSISKIFINDAQQTGVAIKKDDATVLEVVK